MLLLIPTAGYGIYLVRQRSIFVPGGAEAGDLFDNPLLILLPALVALALTLLILRLLPLFMSFFAWLAAHTSSVGFLPGHAIWRGRGWYSTPLVLLMLTLGLSVFTASLAQTLDNHLFDQSYYAIGAGARVGGSWGVTLTRARILPGAPAAEATPTPEPSAITQITGAGGSSFPWTSTSTSKRSRRRPARRLRDGRAGAGSLGADDHDRRRPHRLPQRSPSGATTLRRPALALMNSLAITSDGVLMERSFMRQSGFPRGRHGTG